MSTLRRFTDRRHRPAWLLALLGVASTLWKAVDTWSNIDFLVGRDWGAMMGLAVEVLSWPWLSPLLFAAAVAWLVWAEHSRERIQTGNAPALTEQRVRAERINQCIAKGNTLQERLKNEYRASNVMKGDPLLTELDEWDHETLAVLREVAPLYADYFARDVERKSPEMIARGRRVFGGEMLWFQVGQKLDRLSEILKRNNAGEMV